MFAAGIDFWALACGCYLLGIDLWVLLAGHCRHVPTEVCLHEPLVVQSLLCETLSCCFARELRSILHSVLRRVSRGVLRGVACRGFWIRGNGFTSEIMRVVRQCALVRTIATKIYPKIHDTYCK